MSVGSLRLSSSSRQNGCTGTSLKRFTPNCARRAASECPRSAPWSTPVARLQASAAATPTAPPRAASASSSFAYAQVPPSFSSAQRDLYSSTEFGLCLGRAGVCCLLAAGERDGDADRAPARCQRLIILCLRAGSALVSFCTEGRVQVPGCAWRELTLAIATLQDNALASPLSAARHQRLVLFARSWPEPPDACPPPGYGTVQVQGRLHGLPPLMNLQRRANTGHGPVAGPAVP